MSHQDKLLEDIEDAVNNKLLNFKADLMVTIREKLNAPVSENTTEVTGISSAGIALIKKWEGFREKAYIDAVGVWTIGYGTTSGAWAQKGNKISEEQASRLLQRHVERDFKALSKLLQGSPLLSQQNKVDALLSFIYNIGVNAFASSTMLKKIKSGKGYQEIADEFDRWVYGGGVVLEGLKNRRTDEKRLFLSK